MEEVWQGRKGENVSEKTKMAPIIVSASTMFAKT